MEKELINAETLLKTWKYDMNCVTINMLLDVTQFKPKMWKNTAQKRQRNHVYFQAPEGIVAWITE